MSDFDNARAAGSFANGRVLALQRALLGKGPLRSSACASLAQLRRLGTPGSGSWIQVGNILFDGMPGEDLKRHEQEMMVNAVSCALKLYARHQQGKEGRMALTPPSEGERRKGFGWSCRKIEKDLDKSQGVRRRMQSLESVRDLSGAEFFLRGLIDLMRGKEVQVDYYLLARDLYLIQIPGLRDRVFMEWARDYYAESAVTVEDDSATNGDE